MPIFTGLINPQYEVRLHIAPGTPDVAGNFTPVAWSVRVGKLSGTGYASSNPVPAVVYIDGVAVLDSTWTYNFVGTSEIYIAGGSINIPHNADGTRTFPAGATITMFNPPGGTGYGGGNTTLATIPRASLATWAVPGNAIAGVAKQMNTNRASTAFTHNASWSFGSLEYQTAGLDPATSIGASTMVTIPLSALSQIPNATTGAATFNLDTFSGATKIGGRTSSFTIEAPPSVVPTVNSLTLTDANTTVASQIGAFVQGQSSLQAVVNASGIYGSTISTRRVNVGGTVADSGSTFPLTSSGSVTVVGTAVDSRGRTGTRTETVNVLAYQPPTVNTMLVRRATSAGAPNDSGTYLRLDLNALVQSLVVGGTQKNAMTVRVFTRQKGATSWTARNVISPGLTYNTNVLIAGGGTYGAEQSWEVRVEVSDKLMGTTLQTIVATSAVFMHWGQGLGVGKFWEMGALDVAGDIYSNSNLVLHRGNISSGLWGIGGNGATQRVPGNDFNNAIDTGFYFGTGADANGPPVASTWWNVTVENSGSRSTQYATQVSSVGPRYKRWRNTPATPVTWSDWVLVGHDRVATQAEVNAGATWSVAVTPATLRNSVNLPYAEAAGAGTGGAPIVTFPSGRFSVPPIVTVSLNTYIANAQILATGITTTQFQAVVYNIASGATIDGVQFSWRAVQMGSGGASG